jgi:hypothetical protein
LGGFQPTNSVNVTLAGAVPQLRGVPAFSTVTCLPPADLFYEGGMWLNDTLMPRSTRSTLPMPHSKWRDIAASRFIGGWGCSRLAH